MLLPKTIRNVLWPSKRIIHIKLRSKPRSLLAAFSICRSSRRHALRTHCPLSLIYEGRQADEVWGNGATTYFPAKRGGFLHMTWPDVSEQVWYNSIDGNKPGFRFTEGGFEYVFNQLSLRIPVDGGTWEVIEWFVVNTRFQKSCVAEAWLCDPTLFSSDRISTKGFGLDKDKTASTA